MLGSGSGDVDHLSAHVQFAGASARSSSRSLVPMRRLNTIEEIKNPAEQPAVSVHPPPRSNGEDALNKTGPGSLGGSSLRGRRGPVPAPRRSSSDWVEEDANDSEDTGERVDPPQLPPPRGWVPENQDPGENGAGNALIRQSPHRSMRF